MKQKSILKPFFGIRFPKLMLLYKLFGIVSLAKVKSKI